MWKVWQRGHSGRVTNTLLPPNAGQTVQLGPLGVRFMLGPEQTGGCFSLVEHPMAPRGLGAPMHLHENEDEYSYVLEGEVASRSATTS
jgi:hypothetical protein